MSTNEDDTVDHMLDKGQIYHFTSRHDKSQNNLSTSKGVLGIKTSNQNITPTTYKVHSKEYHQHSWSITIIFIAILISWVFHIDPKIELEWPWLLAGAIFGLYLFETSSKQQRDVELAIKICPLGVQRSSTTTIQSAKHQKCHHQPFIPREYIQDCIVLEHVGAFSVTSHVMFRLVEKIGEDPSSLIPAFPNAILTFDQCHSLTKQIQSALDERI